MEKSNQCNTSEFLLLCYVKNKGSTELGWHEGENCNFRILYIFAVYLELYNFQTIIYYNF